MRRGNRFAARVSAAQRKARYSTKDGGVHVSDVMWETLCAVYQARLNPDRGQRASLNDPTLCALYRRGLVTGRAVEGFDGWIWSTTEDGKAFVLRGRDGA